MTSAVAAFVVIAEFTVSVGNRSAFLDLCTFDSKRSLADEAGCRQFDVITADETSVVLYEVYNDRAAFDNHMTMPHYATFAAGLERLGVTKTQVRFFTRHVADI